MTNLDSFLMGVSFFADSIELKTSYYLDNFMDVFGGGAWAAVCGEDRQMPAANVHGRSTDDFRAKEKARRGEPFPLPL